MKASQLYKYTGELRRSNRRVPPASLSEGRVVAGHNPWLSHESSIEEDQKGYPQKGYP